MAHLPVVDGMRRAARETGALPGSRFEQRLRDAIADAAILGALAGSGLTLVCIFLGFAAATLLRGVGW